MLLEKRIVVIFGDIGGENACSISKQLIYLSTQGSSPVKIIINSKGGDVFEGLFVYDAIRSLAALGNEVTVEGRGVVASMGLLLMQAGTKRIVSKTTRIMLHELSDSIGGTRTKLEHAMEDVRCVNDMLLSIVADRSKFTLKELKEKCKLTDVWFSAQEALDVGLVDEVV
jgi:ATP-dependent Clp protease protease subunit